MKNNIQKVTFAAGCFWHIQAEFDKLPGVIKTTVGYTGGDFKNPTYEDMKTGKTGHAESIEIEFDPDKISYQELLDAFWQMHDPTQKNRQGFDIGSQYRSVIFYHNKEQKELAKKSKEEESKKHIKSIKTEIVPVQKFYPAEKYHQKYFEKTGKKVC